MNDIQYYVLINKDATVDKQQKEEIDKIELEFKDTKLPFSEKYIDVYLLSHDKNECKKYIKNLDKKIQEFFYIEQVGAEIQYTAFLDILGFSNHIKTEITNDYQAEEFYDTFNEVIEYLQFETQDVFQIDSADYLKYIKIKHSWISDTFVISIEYLNEIKKEDENIIRGMMIFRLSMIIASIHHFMASKFGFTVRGGISSKYSCITDNFILGEGVAEAHKLEKEIAIYPRVIFEQNIVSDEIYEIMTRQYRDNDLNFISKDCDGYYFVNYLAILQQIPPMIGKMFKIPNDKIKENTIKQKINVIEKYQNIVIDGLKITNEKIKVKYTWLNNYLGRVLLNKSFQKNIIDN
jgi:hypothetical protein